MANVHLIIGGARSGKSRLAEALAARSKQKVIYIATANAGDSEMAERILHHKEQRPEHWSVVECELRLGNMIDALNAEKNSEGTCLLIDCLTLWLTNCLCKQASENTQDNIQDNTHTVNDNDGSNVAYWQQEKSEFITALKRFKGTVILVSNEVGYGIIPMGKLSREFVDQSGWLHQSIADFAVQVDFVIAGLPLVMKSPIQTKPSVTTVKPWWGKIIEDD